VYISPFFKFFSVSCHISRPTVFVSHFPRFSVFSSYPGTTVYMSHFSRFSFLFTISRILLCWFLNFLVGQIYRHIPVLRVCISLFQCLSEFLAIFHVLKCVFLICHVFQFLAILRS
jgi:hypothetical protein